MRRVRCLCLGAPTLLAALALSCGQSRVDKAQELIDLKMYDQAVKLLEEEILSSPSNALAHFTMGVAHLRQGDGRASEQAFRRAATLEQSYAGKVALLYQQMGSDLFGKDSTEAMAHLSWAAKWYGESKLPKRDQWLPVYLGGYERYSRGEIALAADLFATALEMDPDRDGPKAFLWSCVETGEADRFASSISGYAPWGSLGTKWVRFSSADFQGNNPVVITAAETPSFLAGTTEQSAVLHRYDVIEPVEIDDARVSFIDGSSPVYVAKTGWMIQTDCSAWDCPYYDGGPNRPPRPQGGGRKARQDQILAFPSYLPTFQCGDECSEICVDRLQRNAYGDAPPGTLAGSPAGTTLYDWGRVRHETVKPTGRKQVFNLITDVVGSDWDTCEWSEVAFDYVDHFEPIRKWVAREDVAVGTGDRALDGKRMEFLRDRESWPSDVREHLSRGEITTGMNIPMALAAIGLSYEHRLSVAVQEDEILETFHLDGKALVFTDGKLTEWKNAEPTQATPGSN